MKNNKDILNLQNVNYYNFIFYYKCLLYSSNPVVKAYVSINNGTYNSYIVSQIATLYQVANGTSVSNLSKNLNAIYVPGNILIEIKIINADAGEHPFHLYGHIPYIVEKGTTKTPFDKTPVKVVNPLRRDTFTIPPCNIDANEECVDVGYTTIRFMSDNPGVWLLHCHIEWHIQSGLTMTIVENADTLKKNGLSKFSKELTSTCSL